MMDRSERQQQIFALLEELKQGVRYQRWLAVKTHRRLFLLDVDDITWIEAQGNYVRVHHERGSHLLRQTISALGDQLNPRNFLRIHRSAIVQISRIKELQPWFHGEYRVILQDGTKLMLTRNYRSNLQSAIGKPL
jgi:two-component system, LytTR family, response regulator